MQNKLQVHFRISIKLRLWILVGGEGGGANKVTSYATNLMSTLQETLKASSGIDVKEMLENYAGKGNIRPSIEQLTEEVKKTKTPKVVEVQDLFGSPFFY